MISPLAVLFSLIIAATGQNLAAASDGESLVAGLEPNADPDLIEPPIRETFPLYLGVAWGWNSLEGLGLRGGAYVTPHLALEAGLGVSLTGFTMGAQTRWLLFSGAFTPFISAGAHVHLSGDTEYQDAFGTFTAVGHPAAFADVALGAEFLRQDGLWTSLSAGYAQMVTHQPFTLVGAVPTEVGQQAVEVQYGGGLMFCATLGYAY